MGYDSGLDVIEKMILNNDLGEEASVKGKVYKERYYERIHF